MTYADCAGICAVRSAHSGPAVEDDVSSTRSRCRRHTPRTACSTRTCHTSRYRTWNGRSRVRRSRSRGRPRQGESHRHPLRQRGDGQLGGLSGARLRRQIVKAICRWTSGRSEAPRDACAAATGWFRPADFSAS